jgi:hypothetical protein
MLTSFRGSVKLVAKEVAMPRIECKERKGL